MRRTESTITQKGQVTIPIEFRRRLGLEPHDRVAFELDEDGIRLRPLESRVLRHYGAVRPRNRPEDWAAVREETERLAAEDTAAEDR